MDEYAKRLIELEWDKIKNGTDIRPKIIELLEELKYEAYKEGYNDGYRDGCYGPDPGY